MGTLRSRTANPVAALALALGFAAGARADLSISDTLLAYQLYGRNWVRVEGDAVTSTGGGIGSDRHVDLTNNNVVINGNLSSGDRITTKANVDVAGSLNARGDVTFTDDNSSVLGRVNIGGSLVLSGSNPMGNVFAAPMNIRNSPVAVPAWATNTYNGAVRAGNLNPGNAPPGVVFGANTAFPSNNTRFPDTVVNFDPTKDCTTAPGVVFNMGMCGLGGAAADTILPPGRYGRFDIASGNRIYLTSGTYHFRSLELRSDGIRFMFLQPSGAPTRVLIQDFFTIQSGNQLFAPTRYTDPTFTNGTVYVYVEGVARLNDDNRFWATLVGKNHVVVETGLRLFGQILGDCLTIENGFNGGPGLGRYIPLATRGPLKYSIIHYKHRD